MRLVFVTKKSEQVVLVASESNPCVTEVDLEEEIGNDKENQRYQKEHNATIERTPNQTCRRSLRARSFHCTTRRFLRSHER